MSRSGAAASERGQSSVISDNLLPVFDDDLPDDEPPVLDMGFVSSSRVWRGLFRGMDAAIVFEPKRHHRPVDACVCVPQRSMQSLRATARDLGSAVQWLNTADEPFQYTEDGDAMFMTQIRVSGPRALGRLMNDYCVHSL